MAEVTAREIAGVVHDLNGVLMVMQGCADMLALEVSKHGDGALNDLLETMQRTVEKGAWISNRLMDCCLLNMERSLSKRVERKIDLKSVIVEVVRMARSYREGVRFEVEVSPDLRAVVGDELDIERVLLNLVRNAQEAEGVGKVRIEAENVYEKETAAVWARVVVMDDGAGIEPAVLPRIFLPGFTTKKGNGGQGGAGIGLHVVKQLVERHGGWVEVSSVPGHGTTFKLYFPTIPGVKEETYGEEGGSQ